MGDRTDIDALLIGALYGELTPADEARLTAHLESHPADRTALADLTRTRESVRQSRILSVQFEPPQSVSARLIQEAARRLPKRETQGWLQRLMRVLMVHPAIAVAAMLVLVVGLAATLQRRGSDQAAPPEPSLAASSPAPAASAAAPAQQGAAAENAGSAAPAGAAMDGYAVRLAEGRKQDEATGNDQEPATDVAEGVLVKDRGDGPVETRRAKLEAAKEAPAVDVARADPKPAKAQTKNAGIEVGRSPELMPKELEENQLAKRDSDRGRLESKGVLSDGGGRAAPGAAPPVVASQDQPAAPAPRFAEPVTISPPADDSRDTAKAKAPARKPSASNIAQAPSLPASMPAAAAPPPPPSRAEGPGQRNNRVQADKVGTVDGKAADEKPAEDRALLGWARKQHEQVVVLVKSSKCLAAANLATEIYSRAPDYYATNVATDRSVKPCVAYLNREREREDRSRAAAKRAFSTEAPASTAPSPSKK